MLNNLIFRCLPHIFIIFFIFFEFTPIYIFQTQIIIPYMFFTSFYCWISQDFKKFSPFSIFFLCSLYDLIQGGLVGFTSLFFLFMQYSQRKRFNELISNDFKETWIRFIIGLTAYTSINLLINLFFSKDQISFKNLTISFIFSIALFPLFFLIVEKLSYKFKSYNE